MPDKDDVAEVEAPAPPSSPGRNRPAKPFDIYTRIFGFAAAAIRFTRGFLRSVDGYVVSRQLLRAGTAVGAIMEEADGAESRRDFLHKVKLARKEACEARYWMRLCLATGIGEHEAAAPLFTEIAPSCAY